MFAGKFGRTDGVTAKFNSADIFRVICLAAYFLMWYYWRSSTIVLERFHCWTKNKQLLFHGTWSIMVFLPNTATTYTLALSILQGNFSPMLGFQT